MTIQALLVCIFPIIATSDSSAFPPPDPYAGRREMTQDQIKYWEDPGLEYQIADQQTLRDFLHWGHCKAMDIEVRPIDPFGTRKCSYVVSLIPRDSTQVPTMAFLVEWRRIEAGDSRLDRYEAISATPVNYRRRGDRFEFRFELEAASARSCTFKFALPKDQVSVALRGFPAMAPE